MREGHQSPVGLVLKKITTGLLEEQLEEKIIGTAGGTARGISLLLEELLVLFSFKNNLYSVTQCKNIEMFTILWVLKLLRW